MKYVTIDENNLVTNILVFDTAAEASGFPDIFPLGTTADVAKIGDVYLIPDGEVEVLTTSPAAGGVTFFSGFDFNGTNYSATNADMARLLEIHTAITVEDVYTEIPMTFDNEEELAVTDLNVSALFTAMAAFRRTVITAP